MMRGGAFEVVFGPSPPGTVGGGEVLGFRQIGGGAAGERARLTNDERAEKRRRNKAARQARKRGRR
jgi:hypothetical protein